MRERQIEIAVRVHFQQRFGASDAALHGIVVDPKLRVITAAGRDLQVAHQRRESAWPIGKSEGCDRVESLEDVAYAGYQRAAKRWIEIILLQKSPRRELLGALRTHPPEEPLGD